MVHDIVMPVTESHPVPDRTGWLDWPDYLDAIAADGRRLADAVGAAPTADVPSCPGWTATDLLDHLTYVYLHKIACMREGVAPNPWPPTGHAIEDQPRDFHAAHTELLTELAHHDPDEAGFTWWPADQTHGFWYRRMALETVIHRVDAELAGAEVTTIADPLALDGIDEILSIMLADVDPDEPVAHPVDALIAIDAGDRAWTVDVRADSVLTRREQGPTRREQGTAADTTIAGSPHDLYVWLWGRGSPDVLRVEGDQSRAAELRARLAAAAELRARLGGRGRLSSTPADAGRNPPGRGDIVHACILATAAC